jgi:hypothetical protein
MNSTKNACSLNNQGVDLLVLGESSRAMKVFQSALSLLQKAADEAETTSCTEMNTSACEGASLPFCESASTVSGLQGLRCYVYDHGIMISDNTGETTYLYIAIVLFNLALASHSEGTALGREKSLTKASLLYGLVAQLLSRCKILENAFTAILTLLALDNRAQMHYDQCVYIQSADCMKTISKFTGNVRVLHSALNQEAVQGLLLNVMLRTPTATRAA